MSVCDVACGVLDDARSEADVRSTNRSVVQSNCIAVHCCSTMGRFVGRTPACFGALTVLAFLTY